MSQQEIKEEREPSAARAIGPISGIKKRLEPRWRRLGHPSDEAYMVVMRRLGWRRRRRATLFRCTAPGGHKHASI